MASSFAGQAMAATMATAMAMATSRKFDGDEDGDGKGMWGSVDCGEGGSVQINFEGTVDPLDSLDVDK